MPELEETLEFLEGEPPEIIPEEEEPESGGGWSYNPRKRPGGG
jgi:hypothetical protein